MKREMTVPRTGSVPDWDRAAAQSLLPCRWSPNPPPKVTVQALWREDALLFRLCSDAAPTRAVNTAPDSPVWEDSCLECFLSADGQRYMNLEGNANSAMLAAFGPGRHGRQRLSDMGVRRPTLESRPCGEGWQAVYTVPAETIKALFGVELAAGLRLYANFYVCGDRTPLPCYGAWSEVQTETPDFHRPEYFGVLVLEQALAQFSGAQKT